jgi:dynein heavy chain, axonemal
LGLRKEIVDCQYIAAMNPTAGSFTISDRLQRLFTTFSIFLPGDTDLQSIFSGILSGHLRPFATEVSSLASSLVNASVRLARAVSTRFLPDGDRFMYIVRVIYFLH